MYHSDITLNEEGRFKFCQDLYEDALTRVEMTEKEIGARKMLDIVLHDVSVALSKKKGFPSFAIPIPLPNKKTK